PEIVVPADAPTVDEGLRRRVDAMLGHEGVRLGAGFQMVVVDRVAMGLEQVRRFQAERADMLRHHHAIERGTLVLPVDRVGHRLLLVLRNAAGHRRVALTLPAARTRAGATRWRRRTRSTAPWRRQRA